MKTHQPTTARTIVVACIWFVSLGLRPFDLKEFVMVPFILILCGFIVLRHTLETYRKPLTWKDGFRMIMGVVIFALIVAVFVKFPALAFASDEPYRSMVFIGLYIYLGIYLWRRWNSARQKEKLSHP